VRIAQLANFYGPTSGGQRTAIDEVGRAYLARGHERVLIVPGPRDEQEHGPEGHRIGVRSPKLPGQPYRVITDVERVLALLDAVQPDAVEVSDKLTLWPVGRWARRRGVRATLWSHERIDAILSSRVPAWFPLEVAADRWNTRLVRSFDRVACASAFGAAELTRVGARNVAHVPLGVDLDTFHPSARERATPSGGPGTIHLVCAGRLSKEKRPVVAIEALRVLLARGRDVRLVVAGDGPQGEELRARKARLPITFTGYVGDRRALAALLAGADVALAPCPVESFGLSVLEALACGTPVVTSNRGAAPELLVPGAGLAAASEPTAMADAVEHLLAVPVEQRAAAARHRAEQLPWSATVDALLRVHAGAAGDRTDRPRAAGVLAPA
jgi:alpha-1,6-mannosyltransferase